MSLDILFLGKLFPKDKEAEIKSKMKSGMQDAGNALQWNIIDGLDANECGTVKIIDYLPIDSYPNGYADRRIKEYVFQHSEKYISDDKVVGCTNLTIVKQFFNYRPLKRELKKWLDTDNGAKKVLLIYTASTVFLQLAKYVKRHYQDVVICCVIADIPEFLSARSLGGIAKMFNNYEIKTSQSLYPYIDGFVLLTAQMATKLQLTAPFLVMEGIAAEAAADCDDTLANQYADSRYVLYSGTLNYQFGIKNLVDAFSMVEDSTLKLLICGYGEAEALICEREKTDSRIVFLGKLDRSAVLPLQRGATLLVNPRQNNEEFTKYSFPSKTMEYLAAGVPLVAYKLDGIPDEYDGYIHYVPDNSPEALAATISAVCAMPEEERRAGAARAKQFVLENKSAAVQARRILEFIKTL